MSSTTENLEIRSFIIALESQLDDLPEEDRRDLLEDLEQHLNEVAAEDSGTLTERLGTPEAYAAELRASAGLPPRGEAAAQRFFPTFGRVFSRVQGWIDAKPVRAVLDFLPELRPGWWVLRGYLIVVVVDYFAYTSGSGGAPTLIPWFGGTPLFGVVALAAAVVASVWYGRRAVHGVRRTMTGVGNVLIVVGALAALSAAQHYDSFQAEYTQEVSIPWLHHENDMPISNICAYNSKLRPLGKVLLYDQDGQPIDNTAAPEYGDGTIPGAELERSLGNAFPRRQRVVDPSSGEMVEFACPTFEDEKPEP